MKSLGYQSFYAADNYPKGENLNMGINDGDFLQSTAKFISEQRKPSFSYVITLSSHVPFSTNDQSRALGLDTNKYPDQVGGYLETINYTDRMLGKFFTSLKTMGLFDDSLVIIYGDHTPVLPAFTAGTISYDPGSVKQKEVPLFIKLPRQTTGETHENTGTHLDIVPTAIDLLGVNTDQMMFGKSLFANDNSTFQSCPDQLSLLSKLGNCKTALSIEKSKSSLIIRYNQFNNIRR
ncbi:LTA synthase family protein [Candidatus Saccharibacteria bacterium]|nr:LTA synthase family protein [Candidatus Saccharibacteria bacterium]